MCCGSGYLPDEQSFKISSSALSMTEQSYLKNLKDISAMIMYHPTKSAWKRISSSEDTKETVTL